MLVRPVIILLIFCASPLFGQEIQMIKTFGGYRFEMDTLTLSPKLVLEVMKDNPEAFVRFKQAKKNYNAAGVFGFIGGIMVGFPVGTALAGGEPEWGLAIGGLGVMALSIPFNTAFKRHATSALDIYNRGENGTARVTKRFYWTGTGARIVLRF